MDFPNNAATNIHTLYLNHIRWALYQLDRPTPTNTLGADREAPRAKRAIDITTCTLRHNGFLVYASRDILAFWIFDLSTSPSDPPESQQAKIVQSIGHRDFKSVKSGILASQQLKPVARDTSITRGPPETPRPASAFLPSAGTVTDIVPHIYRAFTLALSSLLVYSLASDGGGQPLGNHSCLRVHQDPTGWATTTGTTEWLRLDVRWSPSGTLTIASRLKPVPLFSRLSSFLESGQDRRRKSLDQNYPVLILPFGTPCKLLGEESQILGAIEACRPFKTSTKEWLEHFGIAIKRELSWVCLEIPKKSVRDSILSNGPAVCHIWWPAHLCFIKQIGSLHEGTTNLKDITTGSFSDPLDEAEQWFLGRHERENIMEARRKETEARELDNNQVPDEEDYTYEEDAADAMLRANQYLSAQEASGIYPTPPDGLASHAQGSVTAQDTPGASNAGGPPHYAVASDAVHGGNAETDSPERFMSAAPFTRDESQDLFGDMFDTNGLTEADFNFFDEPDEADEMQADFAQANHQNVENVLIDNGDGEIGGVHPNDVSTPDAIHVEPHKDMQSAEEHSQYRNSHEPRAEIMGPLTSVVLELTHHESPPPHLLTDDSQIVPHQSEKVNGIEGQAVDLRPETLQPEVHVPQTTNHDRKQSSFELIARDSRPEGFYQKYGYAGKYATGSPKAQSGRRPSKDRRDNEQKIPSLGLLLETSQDSSEETDLSGAEQQSLTDGDDIGDSAVATELANIGMGDDGALEVTKKRKREPSLDSNAPATPASVPPFEAGLETSTDLDLLLEQGYFDLDASINVADLMEDEVMVSRQMYAGNDEGFLEVVQLVANQAIHRMEVSRNATNLINEDKDCSSKTFHTTSALIHDILSRTLPGVQPCDLKTFSELDLNTANNLSQKSFALQQDTDRRRQALLQARGINNQSDFIIETRVPYLNVQRGQDALDIAPSALYFWEELGLAPAQQRRDIEALCIHPDNPAVRGAASTFMTTLQDSYQSCKFGNHRPSPGLMNAQEGLVPVSMTSTDPDVVLNGFSEACEALGIELPLKEADGTNIVVYFVDPFDDDRMYPYICAAFQELQAAYALSAHKAGFTNARVVVLQIVPLSFLANSESLTIPPPKAYTKLAFEVYSRCRPGPRRDGTITAPNISGSAIRIAKTIPKTINFQLSSQPAGNLLGPDPCLHLAYSWNLDQQWLACAWTDNLGATQWNAVYCLGDPNPGYWTAFAATVKEVLETTRDLLQPTTIPWRLYVAKDNILLDRELENIQTSINTGMPTSPVDTSSAAYTPNEQILTPGSHGPGVIHTPGRASQNAPATPSAGGFSDNDPSARLVDVVSQTWIMASPTPILDPYLPRQQFAPILVSGYLVKRAGAENKDGLIPLGINLVATIFPKGETGNHEVHTKTLTEVLRIYSDLATLARLRGLEEWSAGVLPWHVAAARKARKAVTRCMRWGEKK
ncbi:MAG: hypothetical protein Q9221_003216 [Calogaya cf. arnoldii]